MQTTKKHNLLSRLIRFVMGSPDKVPQRPTVATESTGDRVLVIDASPSMEDTDWKPSRLVAAQEASKAYVGRLKREEPSVRISIVTYASSAQTSIGPMPARRYDTIARQIDRITTRSCTNITAGLTLAHKHLARSNAEHQVVLLTDGHHNTGKLPNGIADKLKQRSILEFVGIAGSPADVQEDLLRDIASEHPDGTKRYRWIGNKERLTKHFHELAGRITRAS